MTPLPGGVGILIGLLIIDSFLVFYIINMYYLIHYILPFLIIFVNQSGCSGHKNLTLIV